MKRTRIAANGDETATEESFESSQPATIVEQQQEKITLAEDKDKEQILLLCDELNQSGAWAEVLLQRSKDFVPRIVVPQIPVEELQQPTTIPGIIERFGGGTYIFNFKTREGKFYRKNIRLNVDPLLKGTEGNQPPLPANDQTALINNLVERLTSALTPARENPVIEVLKAQQSETKEFCKTLVELVAKRETPKVDLAGIAAVITAAGAVIAPALAKLFERQNPNASLRDQIDVLKGLQEITQPQEKDESMIKQIADVAGPLLPGLFAAMRGQGQAVLASNGGRVEVITDTPPQQIQAPQQQQTAQGGNEMIQAFVGKMIRAAQRNDDPGFWADSVLALASEEQLTQLRLILQQPNWMQHLFSDQAAVAPYATWFAEVRQLILNDSVNDNNSTASEE